MTTRATLNEEDALSRTYDARLMRRLLVYIRPYMPLVYAALVLLTIEGVLQLVGPLLTQRVIDKALPARDGAAIITATILYALTLIAQFLCSFGETWLTSLLGQRVMRDLRMQIFSHMQRLSIAFFDRNPAGRLITRLTSDVETLNELFTSGVVSGLSCSPVMLPRISGSRIPFRTRKSRGQPHELAPTGSSSVFRMATHRYWGREGRR